MDPQKTKIFVGPPGTGKTRELLNTMELELNDGVHPRRIGFLAFTKKAAQVAKERAIQKFGLHDKDLPYFRTIHSLAFMQLGMKRDQVMQWSHYRELGEKLGMELRATKNVEDGTTYGMTHEERLMFLEGLARIKNEPLEKIWRDADEEEVDWWELDRYARSLEEYKRSRMVWDFTDMISEFIAQGPSVVPQLDVLVVDEAQDLSPLQWEAMDKVAEKCKRVYLAGDDDQCHPEDELVATTSGPKMISQLRPGVDELISWRRDTQTFAKTTKFQISSRSYSGHLVEVCGSATNEVRCTSNHKWFARFTPEAQKNRKLRCVYLMRRGGWYRVGECQIFGPQNQFHLWVRARLEKADAIWILWVGEDRRQAKLKEAMIAAEYGFPTCTFEGCEFSKMELFESLDFCKSASNCLRDHNLDVRYPFFDQERAESKRGGTSIFKLAACNLLSNLMQVPLRVEGESYSQWTTVRVEHRIYCGTVYSLNVEPHHTYVMANGLVTCNCIYRWAGAHVETFINLQGEVKVLNQSHRMPAAVHPLAERIARQITKRREKTYKPRESQGAVKWYVDHEEVDMREGTWLLLARNGYMLTQLEEMCIRNGFSFESVSKSPLQSDSLRAIKTWESLRKGNAVPIEEAAIVARLMSAGRGVNKETRTRLKKADAQSFVTLDELASDFGFNTKAIWHEALDRIPEHEREFFIAARKRGETLTKKPRITISTIHAAKGAEAENTLLLTDMSYRTFTEMQKSGDDEHRVWYVGVTRCLQTLHVVQPKTNLGYEM